MARFIFAITLLTLTIIQKVQASASECNDKAYGDPCGDGINSYCLCANDNDVIYYNSGKGYCSGDGNLVCRETICFSSGRPLKPKKRKGEYMMCYDDSECGGKNFECIYGYCCLKRTGKFANLFK